MGRLGRRIYPDSIVFYRRIDPRVLDGGGMNTFRVLRLPDVRAKTGLGRSTIYRLEATGRCPKRVKLGEHASGWIEAEWDSWIAERIVARERPA